MSLSSTIKDVYAPLNTNPTRRDLFYFGLIVLVGCGVMGAAFRYHLFGWMNPEQAQSIWIAGAAAFVLSFVPGLGRLLYILWMGLGLTIGFFTVPIIMALLYAIVIVPVGIVFRLRRRDTMRRKLDPAASSYWEDYPGSDDPASYIRQF